jgi:hypothetical protein
MPPVLFSSVPYCIITSHILARPHQPGKNRAGDEGGPLCPIGLMVQTLTERRLSRKARVVELQAFCRVRSVRERRDESGRECAFWGLIVERKKQIALGKGSEEFDYPAARELVLAAVGANPRTMKKGHMDSENSCPAKGIGFPAWSYFLISGTSCRRHRKDISSGGKEPACLVYHRGDGPSASLNHPELRV